MSPTPTPKIVATMAPDGEHEIVGVRAWIVQSYNKRTKVKRAFLRYDETFESLMPEHSTAKLRDAFENGQQIDVDVIERLLLNGKMHYSSDTE